MLLNNFLYTRSLLKNEHLQNRLKFSTLVPKTSIYDAIENPFEKDEYIEEIKTVVVKGGEEEVEEELVDEDLKKLEESIEEIEEKNTELKKEVEECKKDKKELKEEKNELKEQIKEEEKKKEEEEKKKEEEEEEEWFSSDDENHEEKTEKDLEKIKKAIAYIGSKKDGGEETDNAIQHKDVIFDNLTKGGGEINNDKDVKNVVVSFF